MLTIILVMLLILLVSAAVIVYVAYPHRGEDVPVVPAVGDAMRKGVEALPTLEPEGGEPVSWTLGRRARG